MPTFFPLIHDFLPIGFRFSPTDEELVNYHLKNKLLGKDSIANNPIAEVDICKFEPCDLPALSVIQSDDQEWYFFCPRDYKYGTSRKFNRATKSGFWKVTGKDLSIKTRDTEEVIGTKKILVYYDGNQPGVKTNWVIHEYHDAVTFDDDTQRNFVLCRLKKKVEKKTEEQAETMICDEGEQSMHMSLDYENQETVEEIPDVSGTLPEINMESIFEEPNQAQRDIPFSTQHRSIYENEDIVIHSPFETIEEEYDFVNPMFIDGDFVTHH